MSWLSLMNWPTTMLPDCGAIQRTKVLAALVVVPLLGVVPERIRILAGVEGIAEQGTEADPVELFALVVVEAPGPIEHEHGRIETRPGFGRELGERRVLQALARLGGRPHSRMLSRLRRSSELVNSARRQASKAVWSAGSASGQTADSSWASCRTVASMPGRASSWSCALAPRASARQQPTTAANRVGMGQFIGLIEFSTR